AVDTRRVGLQRHPEVREGVELFGFEVPTEDSNDKVRNASHRDRLSDGTRIATEASYPQAITQNGDWRSVRPIFVDGECSPRHKRRAEQTKERLGHASDRDLFGVWRTSHVDEIESVRGHILEHGVEVLPHLQRVWTRDVQRLTIVETQGPHKSIRVRGL